MARYLAGRALQVVLVVVGALLTVFVAMTLVSDPAAALLPVGTPDDVVEGFREANGLSDPIWQRLIHFLGNAFTGDFGRSIWLGRDALPAALERLPRTMLLTIPPVLIGALVGVTAGTVSARRPNSKVAQLLDVVSFALISIAEFWIAIMLILLFSVHFRLLPTGGDDDIPKSLVLPMLVLFMRPFAQNYQLAKATMSAEYGKQYVLAARARGVSERAIAIRHVLKNVAVPMITFIFYELGRIFVGVAIVVEVVFAWPGIGSLAVAALEHGDIYLILAIVFVVALVSAMLSFIADALYFVLDPRTRHLINREKR